MSAKVLEYVDRTVVEAPCPQCKKDLRQKGIRVERVLHRFDLATRTLLETKTVGSNGSG